MARTFVAEARPKNDDLSGICYLSSSDTNAFEAVQHVIGKTLDRKASTTFRNFLVKVFYIFIPPFPSSLWRHHSHGNLLHGQIVRYP